MKEQSWISDADRGKLVLQFPGRLEPILVPRQHDAARASVSRIPIEPGSMLAGTGHVANTKMKEQSWISDADCGKLVLQFPGGGEIIADRIAVPRNGKRLVTLTNSLRAFHETRECPL
jgi:hypothetical protein